MILVKIVIYCRYGLLILYPHDSKICGTKHNAMKLFQRIISHMINRNVFMRACVAYHANMCICICAAFVSYVWSLGNFARMIYGPCATSNYIEVAVGN